MPEGETLSEEALAAAKAGNAKPAGSESEPSKTPVSNASGVTKADLEALQAGMMQTLKEGLKANRQSTRDTIDDRVNKSFDTMLIESLKKNLPEGTDFESIRRNAWIESQMTGNNSEASDTSGSPQAPGKSAGSTPSLVEAEIGTILRTHGLSGDEPEIIEYVKANQGKPWFQVGAGLNELAGKIAERSGDAASLSPGSSGGSPPSPNLEAEYIKRVDELRAKGLSRRAGMSALVELQSEFQGKGLDTSKVNLLSRYVG